MIAKTLTENGVPTPAGKEKWAKTTVESILTNEKYKGAALLQKMFTTDFLTKKRKVNNGEVPQYYIEESHEAIISPEEFEQVQAEMTRRQKLGKKYSGNSIFAAKLVCGDCGSFFGSKVWHSNSKYRRVIWQCNSKFKGEHFCSTPHLYEDEIKLRFVNSFAIFFGNRDLVIETSKVIVDELSDTSSVDNKISHATGELERITQQTREHIQNNAHQTPDEYNARYEELVKQFEEKDAALKKLQRKRDERIKKAETMQHFLNCLEAMDEPSDVFDEALWKSTVDKVTVFHDNRMIFQFLDGTEVEG